MSTPKCEYHFFSKIEATNWETAILFSSGEKKLHRDKINYTYFLVLDCEFLCCCCYYFFRQNLEWSKIRKYTTVATATAPIRMVKIAHFFDIGKVYPLYCFAETFVLCALLRFFYSFFIVSDCLLIFAGHEGLQKWLPVCFTITAITFKKKIYLTI